MKKKLLVSLTLMSAVSISAQEVISLQGDSYSNSSGSLDFTIGEVIINTETNANYILNQGFHQSNWQFVGVEDFASEFEVQIFPNPTEDILNIRASTFETVTYSLFDLQGKLVKQNVLTSQQTTIQVGELAPGVYSMVLNNDKQLLKTFKLIKTH